MTQEEKQLLLKDLCARLSYGVIVNVPIIGGSENKKLVSIINEDDGIPCGSVYSCEVRNSNGELVSYEKSTYLLCDIKPYLRPISSMTESEIYKLFDILHIDKGGNDDDWIKINDAVGIKFFFQTGKWVENVAEAYDYLNSIHIDYRGLIEKGLAIEAPEGMYKIE